MEKVLGYTDQPNLTVHIVNHHKIAEEQLLRMCEKIKSDERFDPRWASIAVTHFQEGFMALNRAVFKPRRLTDEEMAALDSPPASS